VIFAEHFCAHIMILWQTVAKREMRSVERGIYSQVHKDHSERTVPVIMAGCIVHARNGRISTSGLKSDG